LRAQRPGERPERTAPVRISVSREAENPWFEVTLTEGRNRQIRRMFEHIGHRVEKIKRVRYGPLELDVPTGEHRRLTPMEVGRLLRLEHSRPVAHLRVERERPTRAFGPVGTRDPQRRSQSRPQFVAPASGSHMPATGENQRDGRYRPANFRPIALSSPARERSARTLRTPGEGSARRRTEGRPQWTASNKVSRLPAGGKTGRGWRRRTANFEPVAPSRPDRERPTKESRATGADDSHPRSQTQPKWAALKSRSRPPAKGETRRVGRYGKGKSKGKGHGKI